MFDNLSRFDTGYEPVFVARHPIFDRARNVWGYELLFRSCASTPKAHIPDEGVATAKVVTDGFTLAARGIPPERKLAINFGAQSLLENVALTLPPERAAVEINEDVQPDQDILASCRELKEIGFTLILDNYVGQEHLAPLLPLADFAKIPAPRLRPGEIIVLSQKLRQHGCGIMACRIETWAELNSAQQLGFTHFQGHFFRRPETLPGRKLPAATMAKFRLIQELAKDESDVARLAEIVSSDPSLAYRLLSFINSALFCLLSTIDSIKQAITILGAGPLRRWAMVVLLSDLDSSDKGVELRQISLHRAFFLGKLAARTDRLPLSAESMFLLGLMSKIDAMLDMTMSFALRDIPLGEELEQALLGADNDAGSWLACLRDMEDGEWDQVHAHLAARGVAPELCALTYLEAADLAREAMGGK
jgi:EAL and modified HD-GYP domain-containing signal transduction protein